MAEHAQIVEIVTPAQAVPDSEVDITVRIKNLYSDPISIMVVGSLEYGEVPWPNVAFPVNWATIGPGDVFEFSGWFTMPGSQVTIHAFSLCYGGDGEWHYDDEMTKVVGVSASAPQVSEFRIADFAKV